MPHRTSEFLGNIYLESVVRAKPSPLKAPPLTLQQSGALREAAAADARQHLYSGCLTLAESLRSIQERSYSWAVVKLYYSVFYLLWADLKAQGDVIAILYGKHVRIRCFAGQSLEACAERTSHALVLRQFMLSRPNSIIATSQVMNMPALEWLEKVRNRVQYSQPGFCDPACIDVLDPFVQTGPAQALAAYQDDTDGLYCSDSDHAVVALSVEALKSAVSTMKRADLDLLNTSEFARVRQRAASNSSIFNTVLT